MKDYYEIIDRHSLHWALGGTAADGGLEQNREELNQLCHFIEQNQIRSWLEIGIAKGGLLRFMRDEMKLAIAGITPDRRPSHEGLNVVYGKSQNPTIVSQFKTFTREVGKLDLIFVDGDHSYEAVKSDYQNYRDMCKFMAFHDACGLRDCEGVKKFLTELKAEYPDMIILCGPEATKSGIAIIEIAKCRKAKPDGISIVMPHAINPENDRVLELNKKMIDENTRGNYELLYLGTTPRPDLVYAGWNYLFEVAAYELVLWSNTDLLLAPAWDVPIYELSRTADWISMRVVECGAIPSYHTMISKDFGRTAEGFQRNEFEAFIAEDIKTRPVQEEGWVWYCPSVLKRSKFKEIGGFGNDPIYPYPQDKDFKERAIKAGWKFSISNHSYAYHLQRAGENQGVNPERVSH